MADLKDDVVSQLEVAVYAKHLPLVAKVAELLAADEELDDARIAACQASILTPLDQFTAVMDRFYAAQTRRAAAIRAMRGEPPVG